MTHAIELPTAGLPRRLAALVYDSLILLSLAMLYGAAAVAIKYGILGYSLASGEKATLGTEVFAGMVLLIQVFYWYFWCRGGQTIGMKAWRMQVVSDAGNGSVSLQQAIIRGIVAPISFLAAGLGYFWCLWQKDGKTWHDLFSGTTVVVHPKSK